jgi:hypothetical protein
VALIKTDVSESTIRSIIKVKRISELGAMLILKEPHDVTSQKAAFFIITAVKPQTSEIKKIIPPGRRPVVKSNEMKTTRVRSETDEISSRYISVLLTQTDTPETEV